MVRLVSSLKNGLDLWVYRSPLRALAEEAAEPLGASGAWAMGSKGGALGAWSWGSCLKVCVLPGTARQAMTWSSGLDEQDFAGSLVANSFLFFFFFFLFFSFLRWHLWHMEFPGLGVESKLQLYVGYGATAIPDPSCLCNLHHSLQQSWIINLLKEARDQTNVSWTLCQFLTHWTTIETPKPVFYLLIFSVFQPLTSLIII